MAERTKVYSCKNVTANAFGLDVSQGGPADGDTITITWPNDYATTEIGNDGSVVISENPAGSYAEVTIRGSQAASFWSLLSALVEGLSATGGLLTGPVLIKDNGGSLLFECPVATLKKRPDVAFGRASQARELVLLCPASHEIGGGN